MAPARRPVDMSHGENGYTTNSDMSAVEAALKAKLSRKRTKTGCLTCRKRRIKCGEERPVCRNCIKSKRQCEGYNQRVVFKAPSFDYRPVANGAAHITFQAGPVPGPANPYQPQYGQAILDPACFSYLQPRSMEQYVPGFNNVDHQQAPLEQQPMYFAQPPQASSAHLPRANYALPPSGPQQQAAAGLPSLPYHAIPQQSPSTANSMHTPAFGVSVNFASQSTQPAGPGANPPYTDSKWHVPFEQQDQKWHLASPANGIPLDKISPTSTVSSRTMSWNHASAPVNSSPSWPSAGYTPRPELMRPIDYQPPQAATYHLQYPGYESTAPPVQPQSHLTPEYYEHEEHVERTNSPTNFLAQAAVEVQDDDYYDVDSNEEMDMETSALSSIDTERQRALHRILEINNITIQDLQTRRYDTFIYGGILDRYRPEEAASPLRNPATARVFAHFISVTGPSLSIFERHPRNTSVLFTEGQIPFSQQGLWTYTMPMAALHHQGLLHSMLALASLHIARLQGASVTPSLQHYAWALKRIHQCVDNHKKRYKLTTIAASMLLGFYEIMTADHMKWNTHLAGSKQLFLETDFVTFAQQFKCMKVERCARRQSSKRKHWTPPELKAQDDILDQIYDIDERMVSQLAGKEVRYEDQGRIMTGKSKIPPALDLSEFEILKDLYWWYLKQDAYQSIVSGNPLLLDYSRWANCPPRAPLGKSDAVYGSFDHLMLLLGRIADFAARDRHRKLRQMEANGGDWRPAAGMKMPGPPKPAPPPTPVSARNGQPPTGNFPVPQPQGSNPPAMPQFYGMAPPPRQNVQMPSSYNPTHGLPTPDTASPKDSIDLHVATQAALEEYGRIRAALHAFESSLGEAFHPLTSDYQPPLETPFGKALFYRSYDIGCLWAIYHMAVIIAIRSHPHMHPAAHAAAAISAHETNFFANEIGRIAAGIVPGPPDQPLNPTLGASLCESCMPSFFAAVQYQNADQRHHTVTRIYSIAKRTGWGSAELIANGCETAWVKAAAAGRGPPYTRVMRQEQADDPRLNGSWERLDPNASPDADDEGDRRLVTAKKPNARLIWAIGIMGMEDDEKPR